MSNVFLVYRYFSDFRRFTNCILYEAKSQSFRPLLGGREVGEKREKGDKGKKGEKEREEEWSKNVYLIGEEGRRGNKTISSTLLRALFHYISKGNEGGWHTNVVRYDSSRGWWWSRNGRTVETIGYHEPTMFQQRLATVLGGIWQSLDQMIVMAMDDWRQPVMVCQWSKV